MEGKSSKRGLTITDRRTLQNRVLETIRESIFQGIFRPNERLIQEDLAEQLGVSRMPVREALHQLEKEGLVITVPHRGSIVAPFTIDDIVEIYTLRLKLEGLAAENSFPNLTYVQTQKLDSILEKMAVANENDEKGYFSELNWEFHRQLLQENKWKRLNSMIEDLWNGFTPYSPAIHGEIDISYKEHKRIVNFIKQTEFDEAIEQYGAHIENSMKRLIKYIENEPSILNLR